MTYSISFYSGEKLFDIIYDSCNQSLNPYKVTSLLCLCSCFMHVRDMFIVTDIRRQIRMIIYNLSLISFHPKLGKFIHKILIVFFYFLCITRDGVMVSLTNLWVLEQTHVYVFITSVTASGFTRKFLFYRRLSHSNQLRKQILCNKPSSNTKTFKCYNILQQVNRYS